LRFKKVQYSVVGCWAFLLGLGVNMNTIFFTEKVTEVNPFSSDGNYDDSWVELSITDTEEYRAMTGKTHVFGLKISKVDKNWMFQAMDYINYNTVLGKKIIFTGEKNDYDTAKDAYIGHSITKLICADLFVRDGAHFKVKDELSLDYVLFIAKLDTVCIDGKVTPKTFAKAADEAFERRI